MSKFLSFLLCICVSVAFHITPSVSYINNTRVCNYSNSEFVYCNASIPYTVRAKDLVDRMTLAEKVAQLGNSALGVPRLKLPEYQWWSEGLHGVSDSGKGAFFDDVVPGATSFPTVILTTAAFNESLWKKIGQAISTEARAMFNLGRGGLTYWSPNVNVVRDPRWGRILETSGEDPFVIGKYAANHVRGLQDVAGHENDTDSNARPLKISSCCKHYSTYDLDNWTNTDRYLFNARVTEQDMIETFQVPFETCVKEGDVSGLMCSYNRVNGVPSCADYRLLQGTIRKEWNFHGYIVSDCEAIDYLVDKQKYLHDAGGDAVAQALKAGVDLDCGTSYPNFTVKAVQQGKVREGDIDKALQNLYTVLMRLGYFDGNPQFESLGKIDICSPQNIELAAEAAREGIVLLKNDNGALPLDSAFVKTLALVGPHANATAAMIGNYAGIPCQYTSPLAGFSAYANVTYAMGCIDARCTVDSFISPAVEASKIADATIIFAGLDLSIEAEVLDRDNLTLPGYQAELINQAALAAKGPVVLVIMSGGGVDISFAKNNTKISSILWAGYPGEEGGRAIADIVFGKYNPSGRLPLTWYEDDYVNKLPMTSMPLRPIKSLGYPGRTYKFFDGSTVYPFGHGLSYTHFSYSIASSEELKLINLNKFQHCRHDIIYNVTDTQPPLCPAVLVGDLKCEEDFRLQLVVQNDGTRDGDEVVLIYSKPPDGITGTHIKQLIGFQRVFVAAGSSQIIEFVFDVCKSLSIVDYAANIMLPSGDHTVIIGNDGGVTLPITVDFIYE